MKITFEHNFCYNLFCSCLLQVAHKVFQSVK